jgi:TolB-like protein/Flp pilus assembly protein TadD
MNPVVQDAVPEQLGRILSSPQFARAGRLSAFLRFIVEEAAAGRTEGLKETVIGTAVFGKSPGYDPKSDSTVRIQASRLREKLRDYYLTGGKDDSLIIELPKGAYVPLIRPVENASPDPKASPDAPARRLSARIVWGALALGLVLLGSTLAWRWSLAPIKSLVVLPLHNLASEPDSEMIADGLTEDLIRQLAAVPGVRVVSQTSSFALKGKGRSIREIGELLDVEGVVEGAVQRVGKHVKVSTQLVRTTDDRTLWSGAFERDFNDLFVLEDELSAAIAAVLHGSLIRSPEKVNPEAYSLYLRGLYAMRHSTPTSAKEAVELFQRAVEKEPLLARAWSAQAFAWYEMGVLESMPARDIAPKVKTAALRALEIDSRLADAHAALALALFFFEQNRQKATEEFRRALELGPNSCEIWSQYASFLMDLGRMDEALEAARRSERLDPLSPAAGRLTASVLYNARRYDEAIARGRQVVERNPEVRSAYRELGRAYLAAGRCEEALDAFHQLDDEGFAGEALARCGRRDEALRILQHLENEAKEDRSRRATGAARVYMALGEPSRAMDYLEYTEREYGYIQRLRDPAWDPLRRDARFIALRKRMGLD